MGNATMVEESSTISLRDFLKERDHDLVWREGDLSLAFSILTVLRTSGWESDPDYRKRFNRYESRIIASRYEGMNPRFTLIKVIYHLDSYIVDHYVEPGKLGVLPYQTLLTILRRLLKIVLGHHSPKYTHDQIMRFKERELSLKLGNSKVAKYTHFLESEGIDAPEFFPEHPTGPDLPGLVPSISRQDVEEANLIEASQFTTIKEKGGEFKIRLGLRIPREHESWARVRAYWYIQHAIHTKLCVDKIEEFLDLVPKLKLIRDNPDEVLHEGNWVDSETQFPESYDELLSPPLGPGVPGPITQEERAPLEDEPLVEYPPTGMVHNRLRTIEELEDLVASGAPITAEVLQIIGRGHDLPPEILNPLIWEFDSQDHHPDVPQDVAQNAERILMRKVFLDQFKEDPASFEKETNLSFYTRYFSDQEMVLLFPGRWRLPPPAYTT